MNNYKSDPYSTFPLAVGTTNDTFFHVYIYIYHVIHFTYNDIIAVFQLEGFTPAVIRFPLDKKWFNYIYIQLERICLTLYLHILSARSKWMLSSGG